MKKQSTNYRMTAFSCLCDSVFRFILPDTAVKGVSRQSHSPHKVTPRDVLRSPFHIELPEPRPVGGHHEFRKIYLCFFIVRPDLTLSVI